MRLTVVIGSLERGGTERHLLQVLPGLARRNFSVEVFCLSHKGSLAGDLVEHGVAVIGRDHRSSQRAIRMVQLLFSTFYLGLRLLFRRPDFVHFFLPAAYILGTPIAFLTRCRIRVMSRRSQNNYQRAQPWIGKIERTWHRCMTAVIGNSEKVVSQLGEEGVSADKLHLIYNGVDLAAFTAGPSRQAARASLNITEGTLVLVIVANLIPYKGHQDLLQALALANADLPEDWVLLCAGRDDGIGPRLQDRARSLGLASHVRWLGSVENIPALLPAADIGLLVSHEEGFSNAIIEYMAAGLPVIATDVGGNGEAVGSGETGLIVPARDSVHLAEAIRRLADDKDMRLRMGDAGRDRAQERYALGTCVEAYIKLYRELA
ncbi:glycosyltransferase [Ferrovibrio terrae]|uniref:glycosyltransferase n=1 Tax=Ferrovibrio terrae TaxID=2594003 RepID=UPI00313783C4